MIKSFDSIPYMWPNSIFDFWLNHWWGITWKSKQIAIQHLIYIMNHWWSYTLNKVHGIKSYLRLNLVMSPNTSKPIQIIITCLAFDSITYDAFHSNNPILDDWLNHWLYFSSTSNSMHWIFDIRLNHWLAAKFNYLHCIFDSWLNHWFH